MGLGLLIGIPAVLATGRLIEAELFRVNVWDPLILGATTALLGAVALLAAALPAPRAARVDPMNALREE